MWFSSCRFSVPQVGKFIFHIQPKSIALILTDDNTTYWKDTFQTSKIPCINVRWITCRETEKQEEEQEDEEAIEE